MDLPSRLARESDASLLPKKGWTAAVSGSFKPKTFFRKKLGKIAEISLEILFQHAFQRILLGA
jgi:hypothetical protein